MHHYQHLAVFAILQVDFSKKAPVGTALLYICNSISKAISLLG
jgi:hypothetical protein